MRVLFVAKDDFYLRNFESLLRELSARGHQVHVAFENPTKYSSGRHLEEVLEAELAGFSTGHAPKRATRRWRCTSDELRRSLDYLRYRDPRYDAAPGLRDRARSLAPGVLRGFLDVPGLGGPTALRALGAILRWAEEGVPASATIARYVRDRRADVVVVSPLLQLGSRQADYLRAAREVGVPTCFCAYSWDNLTTKGVIRGNPDLVAVWNEVQRREAVDLHGVDPDRVVAAGATAYDHWFGWLPRTSRTEFCATVGLPAHRPFLLYVGSALITGQEGAFVEEWVRALRHSDEEAVREAGILLRPHPQRPLGGTEPGFANESDVTVWPPPGAKTLGLEARATLFDSIFHAHAVVGLNTSAFIDAAIIGRPSFAILPPQFRDSQEDTLHFRYLIEVGGGLLTVAKSMEAHARQLARALTDGHRAVPRERFVEAFVRPRGIERSATDALAEAIEAQAVAGPHVDAVGVLTRLGRLALALALSEAIRWPAERVPARAVRRGRRRLRSAGKRARRARKALRRVRRLVLRPGRR